MKPSDSDSNRPYDSVLLIAFGGPERAEDIRPFLSNVLRGRPAPPSRVEEVVRHYETIGGRSPLNELTFRQARALREELGRGGPELPVYVGMRNWRPYLRETLLEMRRAGARRAVGFILSPQQSDASWGRYQRDVEEARSTVEDAPEVEFTCGWHAHPLFLEAVTERVRAALDELPTADRPAARLVFTAHSIPTALAATSPYVSQLREAAAYVAGRLEHPDYVLAYQSRSGNPSDPWLEPDIRAVVREEARRGTRDLVIAPLGFVCDHVEVLYDLDIEARAIAEQLGVRMARAQTVNDHPSFIRMIADVIRLHVKGTATGRRRAISLPAR